MAPLFLAMILLSAFEGIVYFLLVTFSVVVFSVVPIIFITAFYPRLSPSLSGNLGFWHSVRGTFASIVTVFVDGSAFWWVLAVRLVVRQTVVPSKTER